MNVEQLGRSNLGCEKAGTPREGLQPAEIPPIPPFRSAGKIVFWYVLIAGLWIFCTDKFVAAIGADPKAWNEMSTLKGLLFVLVTGSLLFVLIYRLVSRLRHARFSQQIGRAHG